MNTKYIFFDVDGTLISHVGKSHIPPETLEAVKLLKLNGHVPIIATGRSYFLARKAAEEFGIKNLICSDGAEIIFNGEVIIKKYIPGEILNKFYELAKKFPKITAMTDGKYLYTNGVFDNAEEYFNAQAGYNCFKKFEQADKKNILVCYLFVKPELFNESHGIFYDPPKNIKLDFAKDFAEIRNLNTSKWLGICELIKIFNADPNNIITFGDGLNDIEMLKNSNIGVAVEKSPESVKQVADYVTGDIDSGGILEACKKFKLV